MIKKSVQEIFGLLRVGELKKNYIKRSAKSFIILLIISYILNIIIVAILSILLHYLDIFLPKNQTINNLLKEEVSYVFFISVIKGPFFEEMIYRISLKYSTINISCMIGFIFYLLSGEMVSSLFITDETISIRTIASLIFTLLLYLTLINFDSSNFFLRKIWANNKLYIFHLSAISFGFSHIFNFPLTTHLLIYTPLITLPQTLEGIILGYVRLKYGILYSLLMHMAKNALSTSIILLFSNT